jgi:hypothetical protein
MQRIEHHERRDNSRGLPPDRTRSAPATHAPPR